MQAVYRARHPERNGGTSSGLLLPLASCTSDYMPKVCPLGDPTLGRPSIKFSESLQRTTEATMIIICRRKPGRHGESCGLSYYNATYCTSILLQRLASSISAAITERCMCPWHINILTTASADNHHSCRYNPIPCKRGCHMSIGCC